MVPDEQSPKHNVEVAGFGDFVNNLSPQTFQMKEPIEELKINTKNLEQPLVKHIGEMMEDFENSLSELDDPKPGPGPLLMLNKGGSNQVFNK